MAQSRKPGRSVLLASAPLRDKDDSRRDAETQRGEIGEELPEGWVSVPLLGLLPVNYGKGLKSEHRRGGTVPVFGSNGVVGYHDEPLTQGPTLIIGRKGSVGEVHRSSQPCWPIDTTFFSDQFNGVDFDFAFHALRFLDLSQHESSTAIPGLSRDDIYRQEIPLPPLAEQRRIVMQVEALLARVQAARARLAKVPALLKRFRQSVLAAACSGQLTADWREDNPCREAGDALLTRIKSARLQSAESTKNRQQIESAFAESVLGVTDEELALEDIPECWNLCRIGAVATVCNGSTPSRKIPEFWDGEIPWVSSGEVRNNIVRTTRERITKQGYASSSVRLLPRGTVLLAMIGEGKTRGQSAILDIEATINQNIAATVISHGFILPEYLWRWFQLRYEATREQGGGSGPQALNCQRVRELPFLLPPLAEQCEIVRRVEALFALADKIEARVAAATARVGRITQAILAKAFRGELVPTEAELARQEGRDYEPASVLLERIRAERAAAPNATSARGEARHSARKGRKST